MSLSKFMSAARRPLALLLSLLILLSIVGCTVDDVTDGLELAGDIIDLIDEIDTPSQDINTAPVEGNNSEVPQASIDEGGYYYSKEDVELYIRTYAKLPPNFITKDEAEALGWEGGSVERCRDGAAIGGDTFGNREGLLPKKSGRVYYECDIDTYGKSTRGAKRIVYSNDGLIYYTDDHYETFTLLYGEE